MSELSAQPASLVERLHSFFHVEMPSDPELASQYEHDPAGTLAEQFTDLAPADLDDAMRLVSDNTTVTYAEFGVDGPPPLDGESPYAYALRAYEPGAPDGESGLDGLHDLGGIDGGLIGAGADLAVDGGPDLGSEPPSYSDADPSFGDAADTTHGGNGGDDGGLLESSVDMVDPSDLPHDVSSLHEFAHETEVAHDSGSWVDDLHADPNADAGDGGFDPGVG